MDDQRLWDWMQNCPAPECHLRQLLRTPLKACAISAGDSERPAGEVLEERMQQLTALMKEVGRFKPPEAPVLQASLRRLEKLQQLRSECDAVEGEVPHVDVAAPPEDEFAPHIEALPLDQVPPVEDQVISSSLPESEVPA